MDFFSKQPTQNVAPARSIPVGKVERPPVGVPIIMSWKARADGMFFTDAWSTIHYGDIIFVLSNA